MNYPNKIFIAEYNQESLLGLSYHVLVVAAKDLKTANNYVKNILGADARCSCIEGSAYEKIDTTSKAKTLSHNTVHYHSF